MIPYGYFVDLSIMADKKSCNGLIKVIVNQEKSNFNAIEFRT